MSLLKGQENRKHPRHFITLSAPQTPPLEFAITQPTPPLPSRVKFLPSPNNSVASELEEGLTTKRSRDAGVCCQYTWRWAEVLPSFQQRSVSTVTERHSGHVFSRSNHRHRHSSQNTCWGHSRCHRRHCRSQGVAKLRELLPGLPKLRVYHSGV